MSVQAPVTSVQYRRPSVAALDECRLMLSKHKLHGIELWNEMDCEITDVQMATHV